MSYVDIGKRIRERRREQGVSVVDIADSTGLSKATIHRYENGEIRNIKIPIIESIAETLNCNPLWLVGKSETIERATPTHDLISAIDQFISYVEHTKGLMANRKKISSEQKGIVLASLHVARKLLTSRV